MTSQDIAQTQKRMARSSVGHHRSLMDVNVGEIHITPCSATRDTL